MLPRKTKPGNDAAAMDQRRLDPERFKEEISSGPRENHTQRQFTPAAMYFSLSMTKRWKTPLSKPKKQSSGRVRKQSPGTLRPDKSNVKRKPPRADEDDYDNRNKDNGNSRTILGGLLQWH
jgi:hypothetical protein